MEFYRYFKNTTPKIIWGGGGGIPLSEIFRYKLNLTEIESSGVKYSMISYCTGNHPTVNRNTGYLASKTLDCSSVNSY